jgi:glycosyltransferase involved in cell wall biosynthesis
MPLVSVITVNLNDAEGLRKTLQSVAGQDFADKELIVIDGGSTDGSLDVIRTFASSITRWTSEVDQGIYDAQNKGIALANGDYCLFLNSGDHLATPHVLSAVFQEPPEADILYGNMIIDYGGGTTRLGRMPRRITLEHMIGDTLWHPVSFIRRSLFDRFGGYDLRFRMVADYAFFLRMLLVEKVRYSHTGVTVAVFNTGGISSQAKYRGLQLEERRRAQELYFPPSVIDRALHRYRRKYLLTRVLRRIGLN